MFMFNWRPAVSAYNPPTLEEQKRLMDLDKPLLEGRMEVLLQGRERRLTKTLEGQ